MQSDLELANEIAEWYLSQPKVLAKPLLAKTLLSAMQLSKATDELTKAVQEMLSKAEMMKALERAASRDGTG